MNVDDKLRALNDLADQIVAAADLDDDARNDVAVDLNVGEPHLAIHDAITQSRSPLPSALIAQVRQYVDAGWFGDYTASGILRALDHHADRPTATAS